MDRKDVEDVVKQLYSTRLTNDPEQVIPVFADDSIFEMVGADKFSSVVTARGADKNFADLIRQVVSTWDWKRQEIRSILNEGDKAAVHYELTTVSYTER